MSVGAKIKEYRIKCNLTQKDLADKLFVTYQAVSRWENDEVEPSITTIKSMATIFNCSVDDLFGVKQEAGNNAGVDNSSAAPAQAPDPVVEKVIVQQEKPVLALCEQCNKALYDQNEIHRVTNVTRQRHGRSHVNVETKLLLCDDCYKKKLEQDKLVEEAKQKARKAKFIKQPIYGGICIFLAVMGFTFLGMMILDNTFPAEMWYDMSTWGFKKFPGLITTFSPDGIVWLILMKILFAILGVFLVLLGFAFATLICGFCSFFAYPLALYRNVNNIDSTSGLHTN